MGRLIKTETAGKTRTQLTKELVLTIREMGKESTLSHSALDMAAYLVLALKEIENTIDASVEAWEKRDYWVKADRFRQDWEWTGQYAKRLHSALSSEDWADFTIGIASVAQKLRKITISENHRMGRPWEGAYNKLKAKDLA